MPLRRFPRVSQQLKKRRRCVEYRPEKNLQLPLTHFRVKSDVDATSVCMYD